MPKNLQTHTFIDTVKIDVVAPSASGKKLLSDSGFQKDNELYVSGVATHAGILINRRLYRPSRLRGDGFFGYKSMLEPVPNPIVIGHYGDDGRSIGQVSKADFVDTSKGRPDDWYISQWEGDVGKLATGYIKVMDKIVDLDAIARILDGRLNRWSIGFRTNSMVSSIDGYDLLGDEPYPEYLIEGKTEVDGKTVYFMPDKMSFYHRAYTDEPADPWAGVEKIHSSQEEVDSETHSNLQFWARDNATGGFVDMADPDVDKFFRKPVFPVSGRVTRKDRDAFEYPVGDKSLTGLGQEVVERASYILGKDSVSADTPYPDETPRQLLTSLYLLDSLESPGSPLRIETEEKLLRNISEREGVVAFTVGDTRVYVLQEDPSIFVTLLQGTGEALDSAKCDNSSEEKQMEIQQLIDELAKLDKGVLSSFAPVQSLLADQKSQLETQLTEALEAKEAETKATLDSVKSTLETQIKEAKETIDGLQDQIKKDLVDRVFEARKQLGKYSSELLDSEEKVKEVVEKLTSRNLDYLRDCAEELSLELAQRSDSGDTTVVDRVGGQRTNRTDEQKPAEKTLPSWMG